MDEAYPARGRRMEYAGFMKTTLSLILLLSSFFSLDAATSISEWTDLPSIDGERRHALLERAVNSIIPNWDISLGGIAPEVGQVPSFRFSAQALLALWETEGFDHESLLEWTRDLLEKMEESQIRDLLDADPANYPHALYGSILYPGWLGEEQWPQSRDHYEWDAMTTPALIALYLQHKGEMPSDVEESLRRLISFATDGSLKIWAGAVSEPSGDLLEETHVALAYISTLILGGEISGRQDAREKGSLLLEEMLRKIRRHGIHEYAAPDFYAVDLDLLGLLARNSPTEQIGKKTTNLWLYLWTDTLLSLAEDFRGDLAMGGPSALTMNPLNPDGKISSWLYLVGLNNHMPGITDDPGLRLSLDRRPPDALLSLAHIENSREAVACFGENPGEDRSWTRIPGALVGVSSSTSGILDRQLAIDLSLDVARIHLAADRGTGTGGLPEGLGTGHNPMLLATARQGLTIIGLGEIYPFDPEERVTPMLYLPQGEGDPLSSSGSLSLPPEGVGKEWDLHSGDWLAVSVDGWWILAAAYDLAPDNIRLRCPKEEVRGHRVLRLEIHPLYQGQAVLAGFFISLVSKERAPEASDLQTLIQASSITYGMTSLGPELAASAGIVEGSVRAVYDVRANQPVLRDPLPPLQCTGSGPLATPALHWDPHGLSINTPDEDLFIYLPEKVEPREAEGRAQ